MKKHNYFLLLFLAPLILSSCGSMTHTQTTPGRADEIANEGILARPKIFEYTVNLNTRIEGKAEGKINALTTNVEFYKEQALSNANLKPGCDFLVNPTFTIEKMQNNKYVKVTVIGYPGKYTKARNFEDADTLLFYNKFNNYTPQISNNTTHKFIK